ncbi:hypothetical protein EOD40_08095 [Flavobacterium sufflavum]|uniref:Lipoprotein n=1 Tax=Flavobacterium sufflavum TaxID=1921138 RepID=A0A437KVP1_9FLAO|nr:hypothetical protein [Flavobacterium sufflavum]RVT76458.1 hypothetical protein EOD40_08095 [Flavobacterium sufflavum]
MKFNKSILGLSIVAACFFFSCSNDSSTDTETITDDFNYTTVNDLGEIHTVGNKSGKITLSTKFNGLTTTTINLNTVCSNNNSIFLVGHYPPLDKLYIFDKNSKTTTSKILSYPDKIIGFEPMLIALEWNESKSLLYGIIISNPYSETNNVNYFVTINPSTYEVQYSDISFSQKRLYSTFMNDSKFYSTSYTDNLFEINPDGKTATSTLLNNTKIPLTHTAIYSNTIVYGLKANSSINGVNLVKLDLANKTYLDILPNEDYGVFNVNEKDLLTRLTINI